MTYLIIGLIAIGGIMIFSKKNRKTTEDNYEAAIDDLLNKNVAIEVNNTPDKPEAFGYKMVWFAVKSNDKKRIAELLKLKGIQETNWKTGIKNAYNYSVFVSPTIEKWTLVVGLDLPKGDSLESVEEIKMILIELSKELGEAQFFGTHRVVGFNCWMKAINGEIKRIYSFLGESGENIVVFGEPTDIEKKYDLINTISNDDPNFEEEGIDYPDEGLTMEIAENWSVNPTKLDEIDRITELGIIGKR